MSLLRTFRKCYDLAPPSSYISISKSHLHRHSHHLSRNVLLNVTRRLKPSVQLQLQLKLPHRFYSEATKPKEDQNGSTQDDGSQTDSSSVKTEQENTQKLDREAEFATQLQAKQDEIVELTGRLRYAQADFINLQRISAREKEQTKDFAISRFAADLLETADTLTMALRSAPPSNETSSNESSSSSSSPPPAYFQRSTQTSDALLQGVEATHRILLQTLAKYGVKPFDPTGETFDPNRHEALYSAPVPGKPAGEILNCQKLGYMIRDRVLRAAQVGVAAEQQPKEGE